MYTIQLEQILYMKKVHYKNSVHFAGYFPESLYQNRQRSVFCFEKITNFEYKCNSYTKKIAYKIYTYVFCKHHYIIIFLLMHIQKGSLYTVMESVHKAKNISPHLHIMPCRIPNGYLQFFNNN